MKTLRRPRKYCFTDELQQYDGQEEHDLYEGIKELVDAEKLEAYRTLVNETIELKLKTARETLLLGVAAARELSRISVEAGCRVRLRPLQQLFDWQSHFRKDASLRIPLFVRGDILLYGDYRRGARTMIGRMARSRKISPAADGIQSEHDMLPDLRQDDLDARRDCFRLARDLEIKGSSYSNYQSLVKGILLSTVLPASSCVSDDTASHETLTFCRYIRNSLTALLLCLRGVSRTFAGSIMLKVLTETDEQNLKMPQLGTDAPEVHWRPTNNQPININVIHSDTEEVCPAICASSGLEFTRYSTEGEGGEKGKFLVTAVYFIDPHKTVETSSGEVMTVADAIEAIGDLFEFTLPQTLSREVACGHLRSEAAAELILQRLWPPVIRDQAELMMAVLEIGYNILIERID